MLYPVISRSYLIKLLFFSVSTLSLVVDIYFSFQFQQFILTLSKCFWIFFFRATMFSVEYLYDYSPFNIILITLVFEFKNNPNWHCVCTAFSPFLSFLTIAMVVVVCCSVHCCLPVHFWYNINNDIFF